MKRIVAIDSHTGGEPTRTILSGGPELGTDALSQRCERLLRDHADFRSAAICEPRGSDILVGALLVPPTDRGCATGVIFFNNVGTLGMCGHGTIGVVETLRYLGTITAGKHRIETPVGTVDTELHADGRVTVANVASYRWGRAEIDVPGHGRVSGDIAWGGNWFFLTDWDLPIDLAHVDALTDAAWRIRCGLEAAAITGAGGAVIDHIELFGPPAAAGANSRSFVLCPGKAYDRSPCGTGTSAKLACLAADGALAPGAVWVQESVLGTTFQASYRLDGDAVVPSITGTAHVISELTLILDPADAFCHGIRSVPR